MTGIEINVRDAVAEDAADIAELEKIAMGATAWSIESILHDITENDIAAVKVAEVNGIFAGYFDVWMVPGEGMLNDIAVMPEFRRMHVGSALMRALIGHLAEQEADVLSLEVRRSNSAAIKMYEKHGMHAYGVRRGYYQDNGEDAILMEKKGILDL